jgi:hypothetical protein
MPKPQAHDLARLTLAAIRIANGTAGLIAPGFLAKRLRVPEHAAAMGYPFRMFGIRTILIGTDLLASDPEVRQHAVRSAVAIHASDTVSAYFAGASGALPRRAARTTTAISAVNFALAILANRRTR